MTYVMSDLHGRYDLYLKMLERIGFSDADTLYILGDFVDRGPDGFRILLDVMQRPNVRSLMGNHDYYACAILGRLEAGMSDRDRAALSELIDAWHADGGDVTHKAFLRLAPAERRAVLGYMDDLRYVAALTVGGRGFVLCHGGIDHFDPQKPLTDYAPDDFVFCRADYGRVYYRDKFLVTGHTPTACIEGGREGRIYRRNNHIALDCGAVFGMGLGCICLDTLAEFYVK